MDAHDEVYERRLDCRPHSMGDDGTLVEDGGRALAEMYERRLDCRLYSDGRSILEGRERCLRYVVLVQ